MWVDATSAPAIMTPRTPRSPRMWASPSRRPSDAKGAHWLWSWSLAMESASKNKDAAFKFLHLGHQQGLYQAGRQGSRAGATSRRARASPLSPILTIRRPRPFRSGAAVDADCQPDRRHSEQGALRRRAVRGYSRVPGDRHSGDAEPVGRSYRSISVDRRCNSPDTDRAHHAQAGYLK